MSPAARRKEIDKWSRRSGRRQDGAIRWDSDDGRRTETALKVTYLGPQGSFSEIAIRSDADLERAELLPTSSIADAVEAVAASDADKAIVPVENAIAGAIEATERALSAFPGVVVERELTIAVQLCLLAVKGAEIERIRQVVSFPSATAQCGHFLAARLAGAAVEASDSTASAARRVAELASPETAAISSERAAELYGLEVLARSIADDPANWTRFAVVGRPV